MPADAPDSGYHAPAQVSLRGGYCRYYSFGFLTVGGEAAVRVVGNLHVLAGVEVFAVRRVNPSEIALATGVYSYWDQVVPLNLGVMYEFIDGPVQPYAGLDAIAGSYYQGNFAIGGRVRGGVDVMVIEHLGLNLNVAVGAWSGSEWGKVETGTGTFGLLPQISAGTVIAF